MQRIRIKKQLFKKQKLVKFKKQKLVKYRKLVKKQMLVKEPKQEKVLPPLDFD